MAHELAHATLGNAIGHKAPFKRLVYSIGLEGKPTQMLPGSALKKRLAAMIDDVGPFPHATLDFTKMGRTKGRKKWIKVTCNDCGYAVKTTQKWIDWGLPTCCCGDKMEVEGGAEDDE